MISWLIGGIISGVAALISFFCCEAIWNRYRR